MMKCKDCGYVREQDEVEVFLTCDDGKTVQCGDCFCKEISALPILELAEKFGMVNAE